MFKWEIGRQGGKYQKMKIFSWKFMDCYLIKFKKNFQLKIHTDDVNGKIHYRMNILLKGEDAYIGESIFKFWRIIIFRADQPHGTNLLTKDRLLFSIGWVRNI